MKLSNIIAVMQAYPALNIKVAVDGMLLPIKAIKLPLRSDDSMEFVCSEPMQPTTESRTLAKAWKSIANKAKVKCAAAYGSRKLKIDGVAIEHKLIILSANYK